MQYERLMKHSKGRHMRSVRGHEWLARHLNTSERSSKGTVMIFAVVSF